jgi:hypothetical protein
MGESQSTLFSMDFNRAIKIEDRPEQLSGDAGALLLRELFSLLEIDSFLEQRLDDPRCQKRITHPLIELVRTEVLLLAQGYRDLTDADRLRDDPIFRLAVSSRRGTGPLESSEEALVPQGLGSQPTLSRLCRTLIPQHSVLREALIQMTGRRLRLENRGHRRRYATLDVDSFPLEVFGRQEGSAYNGYYGINCYHPLVASLGETGDLLDLRLRKGNAHTADGSLDFILDLLDHMEKEICQVASVRIDAGFPSADLLRGLQEREVAFVARLRKNSRLEKEADQRLRGYDVPQELQFHELSYQAKSWDAPQRVVLVVKPPPSGELFAERFFLLTSWTAEQMCPEDLLDLYRQRGTAEGYFGELKSTLAPTLSSTRRTKRHYRGEVPVNRSEPCDPFAMNETHLLLNALAYSLMHSLRCLSEKATRRGRRLKTIREQILRVPARVLKHARQLTVVPSRPAAKLWAQLRRALEHWRHRKRQLAWS